MTRVNFTANIQRHLACPPMNVTGATVREALEAVFTANPGARHYVLDDQGTVRHHIVVFVDGQQIADPVTLSDPLDADAEIFVMQALSGG